MSAYTDYWEDCIAEAADACGLHLTKAHLVCLAEAAEGGHENYGMAFYSPPPSERLQEIEREWQARLLAVQAEHARYVLNAETAIKRSLGRRSDDQVSIGEDGEVLLYGGRVSRIQ